MRPTQTTQMISVVAQRINETFMLRFIFTIVLSTVMVLAVNAQNYSSQPEKTGFWSTGSTWDEGKMPGKLSAGTVTLDNLTTNIHGTVKSKDNITANESDIHITANDTLVINGNFKLTSNTSVINNGVLIVFGNVSNTDSKSLVSGSGKMVVTGNYTNTNGSNSFNGPTYVFGSTTNLTITVSKEADLRTKDLALYNYLNYIGAAMPIELAYFQATLQNNQVELKWETLTETNNNYFIVERSSDGKHFSEVARVTGAGNSRDRLKYIIFDRNPLPGRSYYKLSQVDFDGTKEGFKVVTVLNSGETSHQPYTNLATDLLIFSCADCNYFVTLKDANGVHLDGIQVTEIELGKFGIDLTQLDRGTYSVNVKVSDTSPSSTLRIIKK